MRHAAPTNRRPLGRAGQLALAAAVYTTAGLTVTLVTLSSALAIWGLWQWLGVS